MLGNEAFCVAIHLYTQIYEVYMQPNNALVMGLAAQSDWKAFM